MAYGFQQVNNENNTKFSFKSSPYYYRLLDTPRDLQEPKPTGRYLKPNGAP